MDRCVKVLGPRTSRKLKLLGVTLTLVVGVIAPSVALLPAPSAEAASLVEVLSFGTNPGNLQMFKYVPDGLPAGSPLVVAMHGCSQSAAAFDNETGWTKWADTFKFTLVVPQQKSANNSSLCFNWFESADYSRGSGEALSIKQMTDKMKTDHASDAARIFATGLSSGGAMANVMLGAYPDVFAGGAPVAGIPYRCATGSTQAFNCMSPGTDLTPTQWGDKVRSASTWTGPWPKVSIWHGTSDTTVVPMNMTETMEQWTNVHGIDQTADVSDTIKGYPHKVYKNASGAALVETFSLTSMGHGQPVDPGTGTDQCGVAGAYILDVNICASYFISQFWGIASGGPPPPPPPDTTFDNSDANDGYVKANADGSAPAVGTLEGTYGLAIGRGSDAKYNRTILSFDTSSIPDTATITRAYVTVAYSTASGDPWASPVGNTLVIDVKTGCYGLCTIETGDWASASTASSVASIAKFTSGTKASTDFSASGLSAINKVGTSQLKLRFSQNQTANYYVFIKKGLDAKLTVVYG